jgi:hypothetical protein
MRLVFATVTMAVALSTTAIAQPAGPDQATNSQQPAVTTDLRAPDRVAPAPPPAVTRAVTTDLRAPDRVAPASPPTVPALATDDGPAAIVFVLIGLGAAMVLVAGGYFGVRYRRRVAIADDLAPVN